MSYKQIIQSPDPDIDTLRCPKCSALWRAKGHYDYDQGGWNYYNETECIDEELCPNGCRNFFGFRTKGKLVNK